MVTGSVVITVTNLNGLNSGLNAVLSGLFFDAPSTSQFNSIPATATLVKRIPQPKATGSAATVPRATTSSAMLRRYPTYATIQPYGELTETWTTSTTAPQALKDASGTGRIAAEWYSATSFVFNVDMVDGQAHDLALYALDWGNQGRVELIQVTDATTGAMLDTETISNFAAGVYLQWVVSGDVLITVTTIAGPNAEISGLFLDPPSTPEPRPPTF